MTSLLLAVLVAASPTPTGTTVISDYAGTKARITNLEARQAALEAAIARLGGQVPASLPTQPVASPTSGPSGTSVTLIGSNYIGAYSVTIGGVAATTFMVVSATQIVVTVPVGAVTGTWVVTTPAGASPPSATFTVTAAVGAPVITTFAANPTAIASGQSATLSWSVSGQTSLSIDQGIGTVTGTSLSVSPAATTTYTLTAANGAGSVTASTTVTVGAPPTISSFAPSSGVVGTSVTLTGTNLAGAAAQFAVGLNSATITTNTSVIVSVPVGASTGPICLTTAGGQVCTATDFTVSAPPAGLATIAVPPWDDESGTGNCTVAQVGGRAQLTCGTGGGYLRYALPSAPTPNQPYVFLLPGVQAGTCSTPWAQIQTYGLRWAQCGWDLSLGTVGACSDGGTATISSVGGGKWSLALTGTFVAGTTYYLVVGCGTAGTLFVDNTLSFAQGQAAPTITSFAASPATINAGQNFTLSWTVSDATSLSIDQSIGTVTPVSSGSRQVAPTSTTTYTLTANGPGGQDTATATVTVVAAGTVATPTASPPAGSYGGTQSVTLSCATAGATICYTTDGSDPAAAVAGTCSAGTTYTGAISVAATETIKALGTKATMTNSAIGSFAYTIGAAGTTIATCTLPTSQAAQSRTAISMPGYNYANPSGTYVTDSYTGARITRVTGTPGATIVTASGASLGVTWPSIAGPRYSKEPAWNADGSWMYFQENSGWMIFLDGNTYAALWARQTVAGHSGIDTRPLPPATTWTANPQNYLAWIDGSCNAGIYNPATDTTTQRYTSDVSGCHIGDSGFGWSGGEGGISDDGKKIAVNGYDGSGALFFVVDLSTGTRVSPVVHVGSAFGWSAVDWAGISPLGNYVVASAAWDDVRVVSVTGGCATTFTGGCVTHSSYAAGHFDVALLSDGTTEGTYCGGYEQFVPMDGSATVTLSGPEPGNYWHSTARNVSAPGWAFMSVDEQGDALSNEIIASDLSGGGLKRFVWTHGDGGEGGGCGYEHYTFPVASPDGRRVFYRSSWGNCSGSVYGFVADVRSVCP